MDFILILWTQFDSANTAKCCLPSALKIFVTSDACQQHFGQVHQNHNENCPISGCVLWDIFTAQTAPIFGHTCLGTLHWCSTQRKQYVIGIQIWYLCKNNVKILVPDSNAEVLSHEQDFKTWKFWRTFRAWRHKDFGAHSELPYPMNKRAKTNTHHGINDTGNSHRHHCHKAQL
jgi:hypothetical protein